MLSPQNEIDLISEHGYTRVVGMDEVGRGCLAGPVVVGAFVYYPGSRAVGGINDSKQVAAPKREKLSLQLQQSDLEYYIEYASAQVVDSLGIGNAIASLMQQVVARLDDGRTLFLVDGQFSQSFGEHSLKVIHGDATYYSIAAASILAKVDRDQWMTTQTPHYPGFTFAQHKGYCTRQHLQELFRLGKTDLHRESFTPIPTIKHVYLNKV